MNTDKIYIFMCSWKRLHNLDNLLINLNNQTCCKNIIFNIWNNNSDFDTILQFENIIIARKDKGIEYEINYYHSNKNLFAFGRFIYIKQILEKYENFEYAIIIDDDQLFSNDYFEKLWQLREKKTFITWYGSILSGRNYWDRSIISMQDIIANKKKYITEYEYGGPGGCIIDASIVNTEFMNIRENYLVTDDIWLSHITRNKLNWKIKRSFLIPELLNTDEDTKEAMWISLGNTKENIYNYCLKDGWNGIKENCLVTLGIGLEYAKGVDRMKKLGIELKISCDFFGYTEYPKEILSHEQIPYGFKYFIIKQKLEEGYKRVIWLDSSVIFTDNLDWVWEHLELYDCMLIENCHDVGRFTSDKCLEYFKFHRKDAYKIKSLCGGLIGFSKSKKSIELLNEMTRLALDGQIFQGHFSNENNEVSTNNKVKGHRHDQSVITLLSNKMNMKGILSNQIVLNYDDDKLCDYKKYIGKYKFIVDRRYVGRY